MGEYSHAVIKNCVVFIELGAYINIQEQTAKVGVSHLNSSVLDAALSLSNTAYCQLNSYDQVL